MLRFFNQKPSEPTMVITPKDFAKIENELDILRIRLLASTEAMELCGKFASYNHELNVHARLNRIVLGGE